MSLGEFSIQISLFSKAKFTRTDVYSISPLTTQDSLVTSSDLDRKLYREVVLSFTFNRVLDTNFTFFKSQIHLPTKERRQARTDMYSSSPLKTKHSLSLRVIFDIKLYREVLWSFTFNRVLDTNFTFFKSKIYLPTKERRQARTDMYSNLPVMSIHCSSFVIQYSLFSIHHSPLIAPLKFELSILKF